MLYHDCAAGEVRAWKACARHSPPSLHLATPSKLKSSRVHDAHECSCRYVPHRCGRASAARCTASAPGHSRASSMMFSSRTHPSRRVSAYVNKRRSCLADSRYSVEGPRPARSGRYVREPLTCRAYRTTVDSMPLRTGASLTRWRWRFARRCAASRCYPLDSDGDRTRLRAMLPLANALTVVPGPYRGSSPSSQSVCLLPLCVPVAWAVHPYTVFALDACACAIVPPCIVLPMRPRLPE